MDGIAVFQCPLCRCFKKPGVGGRVQDGKELDCDNCVNKTCHYCYGEEDYKKHMGECHNIHDINV